MKKILNAVSRQKPGNKESVEFIALSIALAFLILTSFIATQTAEAQSLTAADRSAAAGISEITRSFSANVHDFNNDGWTDVLLVRHNQRPARLYRNDSGRFTEVNVGTFSLKDRHDCAWADVNRDGRPDVYCTLGAVFGTGTNNKELWIQQANGTFRDQASSFGVTDPYGRGRSTTFIDANRDSYPDLFVGNEIPRQDGFPSPNRLFINRNGVSFKEAPEYGLNKELGASCAQAADFDNDGRQDLLVCGRPSKGLRLYRNNRGASFTDITKSAGIDQGSINDAALVDLNNDGLLDLVTVSRSRFQVQLQMNSVFQPPIAVRALNAGVGIAAGDVNGDSFSDLYVLQGGDTATANYPDLMLLNQESGTVFVETPIPQTAQGQGQSVAAIDYDRDGKTDFIVLNGEGGIQGPVQLISFR